MYIGDRRLRCCWSTTRHATTSVLTTTVSRTEQTMTGTPKFAWCCHIPRIEVTGPTISGGRVDWSHGKEHTDQFWSVLPDWAHIYAEFLPRWQGNTANKKVMRLQLPEPLYSLKLSFRACIQLFFETANSGNSDGDGSGLWNHNLLWVALID